jgi:hypothetical protein
MVDLSSLPLRCQTIGRTDRSLYPGGVHFTPEQEAQAKTCASLTLEMRRARAVWSGQTPAWGWRGGSGDPPQAWTPAPHCCAASGCRSIGASPCRRLLNRAGRGLRPNGKRSSTLVHALAAPAVMSTWHRNPSSSQRSCTHPDPPRVQEREPVSERNDGSALP